MQFKSTMTSKDSVVERFSDWQSGPQYSAPSNIVSLKSTDISYESEMADILKEMLTWLRSEEPDHAYKGYFKS